MLIINKIDSLFLLLTHLRNPATKINPKKNLINKANIFPDLDG